MTTCTTARYTNNNNKNYKYYKHNIYNIIKNIKSANSYEYTQDELKNIVDILLEQLQKQTKEVEKLEDFINNKNNIDNRYNDNNNMINYYERQVVILQDQITELKQKVIDAETARPMSENVCCVCMSEETTHAGRKCGHMCVCETCSYHLEDRCPICRAETEFMKIIKS